MTREAAATGPGEQVKLRCQADFLLAVDEWRGRQNGDNILLRLRAIIPAMGARTMTIKTLAAVVGTFAIIVVLFFITKITTPSRLVAKSGFFAGSSTDDWGRGTGATGFWEPIQMPQ